jgi:hypothetical protein
MLNQDANQFTLWQANPTTDEDLVAVDAKNSVISCSDGAQVSQTPTPAPPTAPKESSSHHALSAGAIAGITIGVVIGLLALCALITIGYFTRKRRSDTQIDQQDALYGVEAIPNHGPQELHDKPFVIGPAELDGGLSPENAYNKHELPP